MDTINHSFGVLNSPYDVRDYKFVPTGSCELPEVFELPLVTVRNQGSVGSCVAHALSSIGEYHHMRQHDEQKLFSTEFIYGCRENTYIGEGMMPRGALNTLRKYGNVFYEDLPGNNTCDIAMQNVQAQFEQLKEKAYPNRISTYYRLYGNNAIKEALMTHGYVFVSMHWHTDAKLVDGVYTYTDKKISGAHAVAIYGWNEKGWLAHNSWGTGFGNEGRFIIPFDFKFIEVWGVTDKIVGDEPTIVTPKTGNIREFFYKIYNAIVNFFKKITKRG